MRWHPLLDREDKENWNCYCADFAYLVAVFEVTLEFLLDFGYQSPICQSNFYFEGFKSFLNASHSHLNNGSGRKSCCRLHRASQLSLQRAFVCDLIQHFTMWVTACFKPAILSYGPIPCCPWLTSVRRMKQYQDEYFCDHWNLSRLWCCVSAWLVLPKMQLVPDNPMKQS